MSNLLLDPKDGSPREGFYGHGPIGPSLRTRAILALLLMVGFYVFALAIAGGLLWVPYAKSHGPHRGRLTLFCIIGGLTIL
jgi:hypothetical protein